jgi:hypothetical protein
LHYYEDEPGSTISRQIAHRDERRIAANIAKQPGAADRGQCGEAAGPSPHGIAVDSPDERKQRINLL